ncbi:hypothetical protein Hanom_Chr05g00402381 [Helianthus anomalus]
MGLVPHRLYGQLMWGLYTKWASSPTRLVFWVVFSCLVCISGIRAHDSYRRLTTAILQLNDGDFSN